MHVITYDITNNKRRYKLHKFLKDFGINTQKSVFECLLDAHDLTQIRRYCLTNLNPETDSVRIYRVCKNCMNKVIFSGVGFKITQTDYMVI